MKNNQCKKCGCIYDAEIYGEVCPLCNSEVTNPKILQKENLNFKRQEKTHSVYGAPLIRNEEERRWISEPRGTIYGPPPIDYEPFQEPHPAIYGPSPVNKGSCFVILLIITVFLCGIIVWLLGGCSDISQSTVYGPRPIDTIK